MTGQKKRALAVLVALAGLTSGCALLIAGAVVGAGAIVYSQGELRSTESKSLDRVYLAAIGATSDFGFTLREKRKDAFFGQIDARTARDQPVTITLHRSQPTETEIRIRVGVIGDEMISRELLANIRRRL